MLLVTAACGGRKVKVETAPKPTGPAAVVVHFTNNDNNAVNVYVVNQGSDLFLKQVAANSTEDLPVAGVVEVVIDAQSTIGSHHVKIEEIGRASCRERVCLVV